MARQARKNTNLVENDKRNELMVLKHLNAFIYLQWRIQRGAHPPPPKIGKNKILHTKYPKNIRVSLRNWKKYDFLA